MRQRRTAFSLIELLVVIMILAVMVALLLPAVEQAREAARRSQCKNNLKQLGLAFYNYHQTYKLLPAGWNSSNLHSWASGSLPFIDASNLYNSLNFSNAWTANTEAAETCPPVFRCPSDTGSPHVIPPLIPISAGRSNYAAVSGATLISTRAILISQTHGAFGEDSHLNFEDDFTDGLSYSLLVGERRSAGNVPKNPGGETIWIGVRDNTTQQGQALVIGDCSSANLPNFQGASATIAIGGNITGFSSPHPGGVHFLLGDGSVRFINDKIDATTYANLSTIDDGNAVGEF